ncbi:siderophore ABC transporter substrate-binding protein [Ornithinimicrobium panacihumi]|uniref:siderophore ABC transporter substrate-binding protein n=1 Tax=Ornithinimicrobium panacihumi TaxID=2008449 RepID=UPI003F8A5AB7
MKLKLHRPLQPTRARSATIATLTVGLALTLTACGSDSGAEGGSAGSGSDGASGATGGTVTITDSSGEEVEVPANPETVVVTDWSVTRTLNDLGVELDGIPASTAGLPEDLAGLADVTTVGTVREPDFEGISALEPDLVIIAGRSGTPEVLAEMKKITPNVIDMSVRWEDPADQLGLIEERTVDLGSIFGKEAEAQALMDEATSAVEEIHDEVTAAGTKAMMVQVSGGTVSAYGPGSRFGILHEAFGFADTGAPVDTENSHGQEISQEFFTQYNPDVIYVLDRSKTIGEQAQGALEVLNNGLVDTTNAAKNDKIVEVEGFSWYIADNAPSSITTMIEDVRKGL